jgi:hypothetical protein
MEIKPLRTNDEIEKFIEENYGSYEIYLSKRNEHPPKPTPKPQVVRKSTAETFLDLCDVAAKSLSMSRAEFFTKYSDQYRKYNDLVTGDY